MLIVLKYLTRFALVTALAHLTLELCANFLPVVYPTLINTLGLSYSQVGLIALVATFCGSLTQPLFGYLSDRLGPSRIIIASLVWIAIVMGSVGFIQNYWSLLLLVGLGMLGSAAFHPAGAVLASANASKRRGAAIAVFSVGGNLGAALSPLWVAIGISWLGLSGTVIIIPLALLVTLLLSQQVKQQSAFIDNQLSINRNQQPMRTSEASALIGLVLITLVVMSRSWFQFSIMTYLPEWIQSQGQSLTYGGQVLAVFMFAVSIGSLTGGPLSDHVGRWQIVVLSLTLLSLGQWLFLMASGLWQVGLVALMGLMIGASFPVTIVMAQETWPRGVGVASALVMGLGWAPGGLGAWVTGFIADQFTLAAGLQALIWPPLVGVACAVIYAILHQQQSIRGLGQERTTGT